MDKKAEVVQMNQVGEDVNDSPRKRPPKGFGLNVWKHTVLIGFCVWTSILFFVFTFKPFRMVPIIAPVDVFSSVGNSITDPKMSPGSDAAVAALIFTIVVAAVIVVLMFIEPIMMRILGDWVMDVHDGSGCGGVFARGCLRAPEGTPPPPKGKFIFALIVAICMVEIPMGIYVYKPLIQENLFPIDGNLILADKIAEENNWITATRGMWLAPNNQTHPFHGGAAKDAAYVYAKRKFTAAGPGATCTGSGTACAAIGTGAPPNHPPALHTADACVAAYQTGTPVPVCSKPGMWSGPSLGHCSANPDKGGPNIGKTPCIWTAARQGGPPHMILTSFIEYQQALNSAGYFFFDLLIGMPLIMYLTVPLIMGITSATGCMYGKCGNCLTPCVGCLDPPMGV